MMGFGKSSYSPIPNDVEANTNADLKANSTPALSPDKRKMFRNGFLSSETDMDYEGEEPEWDLPRKQHNVRLFLLVVFMLSCVYSYIPRKYAIPDVSGQAQSLLVGTSPFTWIVHPMPRSSLWGVVQRPYPTGAFWTNLALGDGSAPVALHPYGVKCTPEGVLVSYGPTRRVVSDLAVTDPFDIDVNISVAEKYLSRSISKYDALSVTMEFQVVGGGSYVAHLVKGSAYVTITFENVTPEISSTLMKIAKYERVEYITEVESVDKAVGEQYLLSLGNGQRWLCWASAAIDLRPSVGNPDILRATTLFTGVVRLALLPPPSINTADDAAFKIYMQHVRQYPIGASLSYVYNRNESEVHIRFTTGGSGPLLMYMLPHHIELMNHAKDKAKLGKKEKNVEMEHILTSSASVSAQQALTMVYSIKGKLTPVVGFEWHLVYHIEHLHWDFDLPDDVDNEIMQSLRRQLKADVQIPISPAADPYAFGKEAGRVSRLALIAKSLGDQDSQEKALQELKTKLEPWLIGANPDTLLYDETYGGLVTRTGVADQTADFGAGWYNDHHFHFGYFVHAAATIARLDTTFYHKYRSALDSLVRDVCSLPDSIVDGREDAPANMTDAASNSSMLYTQFPPSRHKDFFDGHSWASGLFPQGNGKGQESSSEAANSYYSCYLYGEATNDTALSNFGRLLLEMEIQAIRHYWQMLDANVYDSYFASSLMVGNVGAFDVTATTWFGSNIEYVHGIQMMPITPATAMILQPAFVKVEWPLLATRLSAAEQDPNASSIPLSTSRNLYTQGKDVQQQTDAYTSRGAKQHFCAANSRCRELKVSGACCPTQDGVMLACCDTAHSSKDSSAHKDDVETFADTLTPALEGPVQDEWKSLLFLDRAVIQRDIALLNIQAQKDFGSGNSKTNSLMWTLSRASPIAGYQGVPRAVTYVAPRECARNSACAASGMRGECCPAPEGWNEWGHFNSTSLGCCPKRMPVTQNPPH